MASPDSLGAVFKKPVKIISRSRLLRPLTAAGVDLRKEWSLHNKEVFRVPEPMIISHLMTYIVTSSPKHFSVSQPSCREYAESGTVMNMMRNWLKSHEEAQVMFASVLVVIGLWWLVRTILTLFINLVCPLLVVLLAVMCVPQLRSPLLGQNYPMLASLLRSILLKLAENIKTK